MNPLYRRFIQFNQTENLIETGDFVLAGVSGGLDSVVLLHLLHQFSSEFSVKLAVVHVNHQLRGGESDKDELFVKELANEFQLPCYTTSVNIRELAENDSLENIARHYRYRMFDQVLKKVGANKLALAHHVDDQSETVLMHLFKGAGVRGLRGILPKRDYIVRPLLFASRQEIKDYAKALKINYRIDSSNSDTQFLRNNMRLNIIPVLQNQLDLNISKGIQRSAAIMRDVDEFISHEINRAYSDCVVEKSKQEILLDIQPFLGYFSVIQAGILIQIIELLRGKDSPARNSELKELQRILNNYRSGMQTRLIGSIEVFVTGTQLAFIKRSAISDPIDIYVNQENRLLDFDITLSIEKMGIEQIDSEDRKNKDVEYIDAEKVKLPFQIRKRVKGDAFYPLGMKQAKKIQDFFVDEKIENYKRDQWPILTDDSQNIIWVCGKRIDDRYKITRETKKIYKLKRTPKT